MRPMPELAPVTRATLPDSENSSGSDGIQRFRSESAGSALSLTLRGSTGKLDACARDSRAHLLGGGATDVVARCERALEREHGVHVLADQGREPAQGVERQLRQIFAFAGGEAYRLFLKGMIQHHVGALVMVKDLLDTAGAGQDAELFSFAADVDSGQRAEIRSMQTLLEKNP